MMPDQMKLRESQKTNETVCVTGAGGFIASWLVKMLLDRGHAVRAAVRTNPNDGGWRYEHLRELEGAKERLQLLKADILDYQSLLAVIQGCHGVFHMAAVLNDDPEQVIEPAVKGTRNVMEACAEAGVKRVVFTSSIGAVYMDPHRDLLAIVNDDCWSDLDYCIQTKNWYCYAKTLAEKSAWEIAQRRNLELVVINPGLVLGPLLQSAMNPSTAHIMKYLTGSAKTYPNLCQVYVDVRDVAEAHILVYETPSASGHRYLCAQISVRRMQPAQRRPGPYVGRTVPSLWPPYQVFRREKSKEAAIQVLESEAEGSGTIIYAYKQVFG